MQDIQREGNEKALQVLGITCLYILKQCRGGFPCERCQTLPLWQPVCVTMQFVGEKVFSRGMLGGSSHVSLMLTCHLFEGLYKAQFAQQKENIKEWLEKRSIVSIFNGFQPTLQLCVDEYVANDTSLLQNAVSFGISPASKALETLDFDSYLDDLIPLFISQLCGGGHEKVFIDTMNAAYRYNKKSTEGVGS